MYMNQNHINKLLPEKDFCDDVEAFVLMHKNVENIESKECDTVPAISPVQMT